MKFSIVTPSFNQGAFIGRCLDSVRAQRGDFEIEHIILDNCSTDATGDALLEYASNPGRVQVRAIVEPDGGQTAAINKGFSLVTGDVVCWLNTDEWYEEGALETVATYLAEHAAVDVAFGDCIFVDASGSFVKRKRELFFAEAMLVFYGCFIPSCATFVRRKVIDAGVLLNPEHKIIMDTDWYVRISRAGFRFAYLPHVLAYFTWHQDNINTNFPARKKVERRMVADRFGGIAGPHWWRTIVYAVMLRFWQGVRVTWRLATWRPTKLARHGQAAN